MVDALVNMLRPIFTSLGVSEADLVTYVTGCAPYIYVILAAIVIMIGGGLNCLLDYIFMGRLGLGIWGAAAATVIGYCVTIVYAVWFYIIARMSSYRLEMAKPDLREIGAICFNGSSDMVSILAGGVSVLFMNHLTYRCYGEVGVSALSVVTYLQFLIEAVFLYGSLFLSPPASDCFFFASSAMIAVFL